MVKPINEFVSYLLDLLTPWGPVAAKRTFGGYGLYRDGRMFAIVVEDTLYLKTDRESLSEFTERGLEPFSYDRNGKIVSMSYYQPPPESLDRAESLIPWVELAYQAALRSPAKRKNLQ